MQKQYYGIADAYYDNVIKHHGILGQKWGVRRFQNADGSLTPAGRERYGYNANSLKGATAGEENRKAFVKHLNRYATKELSDLHSAESDCKKVMADFDKDEYRYGAISALTNAFREDFEYCRKDMDSIARYMWGYAREDFDQGAINAYSCYVLSGNRLKDAQRALNNFDSAEKTYTKKIEEASKKELGESAYESAYEKWNQPLYKALGYDAMNTANGKNDYGWWDGASPLKAALYDIPRPKDRELNEDLRKATDIVDKIGNLSNQKCIDNLTTALAETNLASKNYDDMTDDDWKRLSAKVASYK